MLTMLSDSLALVQGIVVRVRGALLIGGDRNALDGSPSVIPLRSHMARGSRRGWTALAMAALLLMMATVISCRHRSINADALTVQAPLLDACCGKVFVVWRCAEVAVLLK